MNRLKDRMSWDEIVNHIADYIDKRNPRFKRNKFIKWFQTKEYIGKTFDPIMIYHAYTIYKRLEDDKDNFTIVTGLEGEGKTTLGTNLCCLVDEKFNVAKTCLSAGDFIMALRDVKPKSSILLDEGGVMLFSRESMTMTNKLFTKAFMVMRAKNLNLVICVPNFFLLDSYIRHHRANSLIYIKKRGYYRGINRQGIAVINKKGSQSQRLLSIKMDAGYFWDGKFSKEISSSYDTDAYMRKKFLHIDLYLKEASKEMVELKMVPLKRVAIEMGIKNTRNLRRMIARGEIKGKKIANTWFIDIESYKKLMDMGGNSKQIVVS